MRPRTFDVDPPDVDVDGIAEAQTTAGAADLILNGALCDLGTAGRFDIGDSYSSGVGGVQLVFDSAGDINTVVFTITGKDADGKPQTETVTGVTTTEVETTKYWSQVTRIAADSEVTSNVTVGTVDEVVGRAYVLDYVRSPQATIAVNVTGTIDYSVEQTFDPPQQADFDLQQEASWYPISDDLTGETVDRVGAAASGATAVRLKVNSYSSGAEIQMTVTQPWDI
jgi:hypothetical protein